MNVRSEWRAAAPILAIGAAIGGFAIAQVVVDESPLLTELLDAGILLVFASAVVAVGYRLATEGVSWAAAKRVLAFTIGSSLVVGGLSGVFVVSRLASAQQMAGLGFIVTIGFSLGAGAGALIGYYLNRYETSLQHEAELSRRLTVLQRVLRHNIRNEVTIIEGVSAELTDVVDDPEAERYADIITDHIGKVHRVAEKSQELATVWQTDETIALDAVNAVTDAVTAAKNEHPSVTVTDSLPDSLPVDAHPRIGIAFEEILDNAARHNENVTVEISATVDDDSATIWFADTGGGIPDGEIEPLVRGHERPLAHTTGIGLWFMYWLVDHSHGDLSFSETDTGGALVEITLPRS